MVTYRRLSNSHYGQMMQADDPRDDPRRDYRTLPPAVSLDDTIASVEPDPAPDPAAGRNVDQHRALRDD